MSDEVKVSLQERLIYHGAWSYDKSISLKISDKHGNQYVSSNSLNYNGEKFNRIHNSHRLDKDTGRHNTSENIQNGTNYTRESSTSIDKRKCHPKMAKSIANIFTGTSMPNNSTNLLDVRKDSRTTKRLRPENNFFSLISKCCPIASKGETQVSNMDNLSCAENKSTKKINDTMMSEKSIRPILSEYSKMELNSGDFMLNTPSSALRPNSFNCQKMLQRTEQNHSKVYMLELTGNKNIGLGSRDPANNTLQVSTSSNKCNFAHNLLGASHSVHNNILGSNGLMQKKNSNTIRGCSNDKLLNTNNWSKNFGKISPSSTKIGPESSKNAQNFDKIDIFQRLTDNFLQKKIRSRTVRSSALFKEGGHLGLAETISNLELFRRIVNLNGDFKMPQNPCGKQLDIVVYSNWYQSSKIGVTGLEIFDGAGNQLILDSSQFACSVNSNNPDRLFDGVYITENKETWNCTFNQNCPTKLTVSFETNTTISMVRVWNYSKSKTNFNDISGIKNMTIL